MSTVTYTKKHEICAGMKIQTVTINLDDHWMASLFHRMMSENLLIWAEKLTFLGNGLARMPVLFTYIHVGVSVSKPKLFFVMKFLKVKKKYSVFCIRVKKNVVPTMVKTFYIYFP